MAGTGREEVEDNEDKGVQDAFASRAPGTFFFRLYYFTILY